MWCFFFKTLKQLEHWFNWIDVIVYTALWIQSAIDLILYTPMVDKPKIFWNIELNVSKI